MQKVINIMTDKALKIGGFILALACMFMISFVFFCISVNHTEELDIKANEKINKLIIKVDSLEAVINTSFFKNRRDTIIVKTYPQEIKFYSK